MESLTRGFLHTNLSDGARNSQRADPHVAQGVIQIGAVKSAVAVFFDNQVAVIGP